MVLIIRITNYQTSGKFLYLAWTVIRIVGTFDNHISHSTLTSDNFLMEQYLFPASRGEDSDSRQPGSTEDREIPIEGNQGLYYAFTDFLQFWNWLNLLLVNKSKLYDMQNMEGSKF